MPELPKRLPIGLQATVVAQIDEGSCCENEFEGPIPELGRKLEPTFAHPSRYNVQKHEIRTGPNLMFFI